MSRIAFVFPGQGAQAVGMGQVFYAQSDEARALFDQFDALITPNRNPALSELCFEGPEELLKRTLYTQPAILAVSLCALAAFQARTGIRPVVTAGHSLGEYGALVAAGVITPETAIKLIQKRASLMEQAPPGAMAVVLGLPSLRVETVLNELELPDGELVVVANDNAMDQCVISGTEAGVQQAAEPLKAAGAKRVMPLAVGGAFHSPLMRQAAENFQAFLVQFAFNNAQCPVICNVDAQSTRDAAELHAKLGQQIDHGVKWVQTMETLFSRENVDTVIEFGPGKVLTGMIRKSYPSVVLYNISDPASLDEVCQRLDEAGVVAS